MTALSLTLYWKYRNNNVKMVINVEGRAGHDHIPTGLRRRSHRPLQHSVALQGRRESSVILLSFAYKRTGQFLL